MKIVVDFTRCESNALCVSAAPEVFQISDADSLHILQVEPSEDLRSKVEEAARRCPTQAISIESS